MTDLYSEEKRDTNTQDGRLEDSQLPDAVGVYDRPEESGLPSALVAVIGLMLLVVAAAIFILLIL
ncbi:MAG TPA: hypothetical protein VK879_22875 [Candidatus Sulfomarinibacteraceae bacterium]|nr:hypothetical protein [Candidatus Sulfomarinibacteraceae bacterium]